MRFAENTTFDNLFQLNYEELIGGFKLQGRWQTDFFRNSHDIILELGCGKGEYTTGLAERHPHQNYIGTDIKGARLWRGLKTAQQKNLGNVAFIRTRINLIPYVFGADEISELWITFPDPQPRAINAKKRLTSPEFLARYRQFLKADGRIHLKTDNIIFFEYTLDVIKEEGHELLYSNYDVYGSDLDNEVVHIQTFYEKIWLENGTKIKYLIFKLKPIG